MTEQKALKQRVRGRMEKTGERYTTARRQALAKGGEPTAPEADTDGPAPATPEAVDPPASLTSEDAVRTNTGRPSEQWSALLDDWGATQRSHGEIAAWLSGEHGVSGWWAQTLTVNYERARGMRAPGQTPDGTFSASASKTIDVPVARLFEAFADESLRERWLAGAPFEVRTAQPDRSLRANWEGGATRVNFGFVAKGEAKSQVALAHERLADAEAREAMKVYWRERLRALKQLVEDS